MRKLIFAISVLALSAGSVAASDDPIATRKALMQANGASIGVALGMLKEELSYNPAVAKAAIATLNGTAAAFGDYFPEGSESGGNTEASPKIWEDMAGFQKEMEKYRTVAAAAVDAAGKDGPADLPSFEAALKPLLGSCKSCHEAFRIKKN